MTSPMESLNSPGPARFLLMQAAQKMRGNSTSHWDHGHWRKCEADIGYVICSHRFEWLIFQVGFVDGKKLVVLSLADKVASLLPQVTHVIHLHGKVNLHSS